MLHSSRWLLRVLDPGTLSRPSFRTPEDVARWWVRTIPRGRVAALGGWPAPAFDHRDPRFHRLFVVAYSAPGDTNPSHRLGVFLTAFRNDINGRWRLLEATLTP